jgi:hypothetical protein
LAQAATAPAAATTSIQTTLYDPEQMQTRDIIASVGFLPGSMEVEGRVRIVLHDARGDVNGVLLEDGAVLPDPAPAQLVG